MIAMAKGKEPQQVKGNCFPAQIECDVCWFNIRRWRILMGFANDEWVQVCPCCGADQFPH